MDNKEIISIKNYSIEDKELLIQFIEDLQDYLVQIDPLKRLRRLPLYGQKYIADLLKKIKENNGAIFIARIESVPVGFIAGTIKIQDEENLLECIPTKAGRVQELIVSEKHRGKKIGSQLMQKIEEYFQQQNCTIVRVEVFEPNESAHNFYKKLEYRDRVIDMIKTFNNE